MKCDCGQTKVFRGTSLRIGKVKSCGINGHTWRTTQRGLEAGDTKTPEYATWRSIIKRCSDLKNPNYGGRGITVCDRWISSFRAFLEDVGAKPTPKHTIDRYPNNDGNYEPGNCRWATAVEQCRNTRRNVYLEVDGERLLLLEYVEKMGLNYTHIHSRLKNGWTLDEALTTPVAHWVNRKPKD